MAPTPIDYTLAVLHQRRRGSGSHPPHDRPSLLQSKDSSDHKVLVPRSQLNKDKFVSFHKTKSRRRPLRLEARICQSTNGFYLKDNHIRYIGGADPMASHKPEVSQPKMDDIRVRKLVLSKFSGLLSGTVHGDLLGSWGLEDTNRYQYGPLYTATSPDSTVSDKSKHPYRIGIFCTCGKSLRMIRDAVTGLIRDGYYFTPLRHVYGDGFELYHHVDRQLKIWGIVSKATGSLREIVKEEGADLVRAFIITRALLRNGTAVRKVSFAVKRESQLIYLDVRSSDSAAPKKSSRCH